MAPSSDKARGPLDTAIDWLYVAWVRAAAWNDAQRKSYESPAGVAKVFLVSCVMIGAMVVVFGTGKRVWTKKVGAYGTVQLQHRFSWNRGAMEKDGYAIYPDRRVAAIWYGPREYGSVPDQVRLVTAAIESFRPAS